MEKARRMGKKRILAYKLDVEQHMKFLTDKKAYTVYVEYWNSKLKNKNRIAPPQIDLIFEPSTQRSPRYPDALIDTQGKILQDFRLFVERQPKEWDEIFALEILKEFMQQGDSNERSGL